MQYSNGMIQQIIILYSNFLITIRATLLMVSLFYFRRQRRLFHCRNIVRCFLFLHFFIFSSFYSPPVATVAFVLYGIVCLCSTTIPFSLDFADLSIATNCGPKSLPRAHPVSFMVQSGFSSISTIVVSMPLIY